MSHRGNPRHQHSQDRASQHQPASMAHKKSRAVNRNPSEQSSEYQPREKRNNKKKVIKSHAKPKRKPRTNRIARKNQSLPQASSQQIRIQIKTVNRDLKEATVSKDITGLELKEYIVQNVCSSLDALSMSLEYEGTVIANRRKLSEFNIVVGSHFRITQGKISIAEVTNIIADIHGIDLISDQKGVAKMSCGHSSGRDTMTALIKSLISTNKFEIRCPYPDENEQTCNARWQFKDCRKVGVFTREEVEEFQKGLSLNWMKEFSKQCPRCKSQICKLDLNTNRVRCPSCKHEDFCYMCLKPWKTTDKKSCGNQECTFLVTFLTSCSWNRQFLLRDEKGQTMPYMTPQYRACPHCKTVIEHRQACKHMTCNGCAKSFCWVCLSMLSKNGWPCGRYNQYCGKVAQVQNLD